MGNYGGFAPIPPPAFLKESGAKNFEIILSLIKKFSEILKNPFSKGFLSRRRQLLSGGHSPHNPT
jgi:hypothetical protein